MPSLTSQSEEFPGKRFELTGPKLPLGRVADNALQIEHNSVSSHHAELMLDGNDYKVVDLESTNGTRVNGERISESKLRRGDTVRFGNIDFSYDSEYSAPASALPSPSSGLDLSGSAFKGRPEHFVSASPFPKTQQDEKGPWKWLILAGSLLAVGGLGYFLYVIFLNGS
jgi:hypothetical protein